MSERASKPYKYYLYNVLLEYFLVLTYIQVGVRRLTPVGHTCVCNAYAGSVRTHNVYAQCVYACVCVGMHLDVGV